MKCHSCGKADYKLEVRDESYSYRGQTITFKQEAEYCPACGESIMNDAQAKEMSEKIASFRAEVDKAFLPSEEIKRIRKKLRISQQEAATIFGGGINAFSMYERGQARQHKSTDILLRVLDRHPDLLPEIKTVALGGEKASSHA